MIWKDADALGNGQEGKHDRDNLAKPEGIFKGRTSTPPHDIVDNSHPGTPETETEFDWDDTDTSDEEEREAHKHAKEEELVDRHRHNVRSAKRLRKVYLGCMRISRPFRTLLIALLGGGFLIIPSLVVWTSFDNANSSHTARINVKIWSLWLSIVWVSACGTSIFVDAIPWIVNKISVLLTGLYPQAIKAKVVCEYVAPQTDYCG